jgi:FAD/FMN-containing dehydrogenase
MSVRALIWCEEVGDQTSEVFVELGGSEEGVAHDRSSLAGTLSLEAVEADRIDTLRDARTLYGRSERDGDSEGDHGVGDDAEFKADEDGVVLRVRVLGSQCEAVRRVVLAAGLSVSIDPGLGVIHARGRLSNLEALLAIRSTAERAGGFATFEQLPDAWRGEVDVFGSLGGSEPLVQTLKSKFDPAGILNPGRYVADRLEDSSRER